MSAATDARLVAFADLLRGADEPLRDGLISRAKLLALQGADVDALPVLLSRDDWGTETVSRLEKVTALIDQAGWHDLAPRLLDSDDNAQAARDALESRIRSELVVGQDQASRLLTAALGASGGTLGRTAAELLAQVPESPNYYVPGLLARGWTVKVAAREKGGKGTLIFYLLAALEHRRKTVFGDAYADAVTALIVTEEPQESVREKVAKFGLKRARIIYGHELGGMDWDERCQLIAARAVAEGHEIVFQDNISRAARVEDENGTELARAAEAQSDACKANGLSFLFDHHHKKGGASIEDKSRGGTALAGMADNNVELVTSGGPTSRFRRVTSKGRLESSLWERTIVLDKSGSNYTGVTDADEPEDADTRHRLDKLRDHGVAGVTVAEFMAAIGSSEDTARRTLKEFVQEDYAVTDDMRPARYFHKSVRSKDGEPYPV